VPALWWPALGVPQGRNVPVADKVNAARELPRLLDLFCGGGGAALGYYLAGFEVVGVDVKAQPRYPFAFFQADALEFASLYGYRFDAIHASPPCQAYSRLAARHPEQDYPDLIAPTRKVLEAAGTPYVIENVPEAPLHAPVTLCGSWWGLGTEDFQLRRHRSFEANWPLHGRPCEHGTRPTISVAGHAGRAGRNGSGTSAERREAMGIPWLPGDALSEAIPPVYTEEIGMQLLAHLREELPVMDHDCGDYFEGSCPCVRGAA
jgi:DNA (cytosine-5)-methyltransferase 1